MRFWKFMALLHFANILWWWKLGFLYFSGCEGAALPMPARKDAKSSKCLGTSWSLGRLHLERGVNQKKDWMESGSSSWQIDFTVWCQNYLWCIISKAWVPNDTTDDIRFAPFRLHGRSAHHTLSSSFCALCNMEEETAQAWPENPPRDDWWWSIDPCSVDAIGKPMKA